LPQSDYAYASRNQTTQNRRFCIMIRPEFFDIFGIVTFIILLYIGVSLRKKEKVLSKIVIAIGLLGLATDLYVVISKFILGN